MSAVDFHTGTGWLKGDAPEGDVIVSSRARLARNLAGRLFVNQAADEQLGDVVDRVKRATTRFKPDPAITWVDLAEAKPVDRKILVERHLISTNLSEGKKRRAVGISRDETLSLMVNEEDHIRMQVLRPGLQLEAALDRAGTLDDAMEETLEFAFDERFGYLTACPTNLGTGLRLGVMAHLPGLKLAEELDRVRRSAKELHLAVRGFYGEGTESTGDFYQISNQITLGCTHEDLLEEFRDRIVPEIIDYERTARQILLDKKRALLEDRIFRSFGVLTNARLLGAEEAMKLLSRVRLGACLGRLPGVERKVVDELFLRVQPAHLEALAAERLEPIDTRELRATLVREALGG